MRPLSRVVSSPRVLLLDDSPSDRDAITRALRREIPDLRVDSIDGSADFELRLRSASFDLLITDYKLRESNGLDILRATTRLDPGRPVIMYTANGNEEVAVQGIKDGLADYIAKSPVNLERLAHSVREALRSQGRASPSSHPDERFHSLFQGLPLGLYLSTPQGRFLDVNAALVRLLRYPDRGTLMQAEAQDLYLSVDDRHRWRIQHHGEHEVDDFETRLRTFDGRVIWVFENRRAVKKKSGRVLYYQGCIQDITSRKRTEEALRRSESRYRRLTTSALEGIGIHHNGKILDANEQVARMFGYTLEEFTGTNVINHTDPEFRQHVIRNISEGRESQYEAQGIHKDGHTFPIEVIARPVPYLGRTMRVLAVRDVSKIKGAIRALKESEEKYSSLFRQSSDALLIHDIDGRVLDANEKAWGLLGRSLAELQSLDMRALLGSREWRRHRHALMRDGFAERKTVWQRASDDPLTTEVAANLFEVSGKRMVQCIIRDNRDRARLREQIRHAQKMEVVGRLAGGVAHDFNNLLTVTNMYSEILLNRLGNDPLSEHVKEISKATERASALTSQLLAFSRRQVLQPRVLDLNELVSHLGRMLRRLIGEHITLDTILALDLPPIFADPGQLEQAILNMVVNSRDAMPEGGRVTIRTAKAPADAEPAKAEHVMLAISDTGIGMESETLSHIFEPFFTTKEPGKGTGLGLSMAYGIIRQSGGFIEVESDPGHETTFRIYVPQTEGQPAPQQEPPAGLLEHEGGESVLVVDDETPLRQLMCSVLQGHGYQVFEAHGHDEALSLLENENEAIEVLLAKADLPQLGGLELAKSASRHGRRLKVLLIASQSDAELVSTASPFDVQLLRKPFTAEELFAGLRKLTAQSHPPELMNEKRGGRPGGTGHPP